ncbi:aminopeptidase [Chryseotalea sanaruensis]|uniref:Aminopeptidase n=1 Tax=Chryseotalea sanaruensis TaxID=2482724 RepID=A0A401U7P7_9BACT|nr:M1 family metallopeptidase [Chryseotalea sanaruensis]GCC50913.1 aminopeptidase [Chryseotalea sanaruensis]
MKIKLLFSLLLLSAVAYAQSPGWQGKFEQLDQLLPTPNEYRSGSGAPGPRYWQQRADYVINAELNDVNQSITGSETITYFNNSPDVLKYLWLQLDQNINDKESNTLKTATSTVRDSIDTKSIASSLVLHDFDGGFKIKSVKDATGKALPYTINATMMRIDLPQALAPGQKFSFSVEWSFNINDRVKGYTTNDGRSGMEYFPKDGNYLYIIAQWFPRMCVYDDVVGWQNKQFLGQGEFTLTFGNYVVNLTVPADHIVAATGMVQNAKEVLTPEQYARFEKAKTSFDKPVIIATQQEAEQREKTKSTAKKTWKFYAENVRDFAFATSRKFIWDAQAVKIGDKTPLAMSYYPKEGNPLWEQESTKAVKYTLETYSKYTIDYPYPQATSVHAASLGMEYPMICFNYGRPLEDGTIPERTKWGMIGVIVHEVGHNFFPMIINSDERQWTWMDEGLNTFVQYRTQVENYPDMPQRRGPASTIVPYMKGNADLQRPLMVNSESVVRANFGNEQYAKCATGLNMLRETVMGPELFDKAFKEYASRWAFKHPKPADLFRTMEDASAVDLDWFWRGWFYTTDVCDQSIEQVRWLTVRTENSKVENKGVSAKRGDLASGSSTNQANDFSNGPQPITVLPTPDYFYGEFRSRVDDKAVLAKLENKNLYEVTLTNNGGLIMPVIIEWTYKDGSKELERIPAEIWRTNEQRITKVFVKDKEVTKVVLDPKMETTDISLEDNVFPKVQSPSKIDQLKKK